MSGAIARRLVTGGTLLLAAFLAADAAEIDDDLPDLAEQIAQVASEVAIELQQVCSPASPSDQAAFDRCRRSLFGDSALAQSCAAALVGPPQSGRRSRAQGYQPHTVRARRDRRALHLAVHVQCLGSELINS